MAEAEELRGSETVLIVDDDDDARDAMSRTLEYHGYTVLQARGGREAVDLLEETDADVDLLLVDVVMPGMTGISLSEEIAERHPDTPILFTSGYADEGVATPAQMEGRTHFLKKPMTIRALAEKVREVLDGGGD